MSDKNLLCYASNGVGYVFSAIQNNELLSTISFIITILATLLTIGVSILEIYTKYKKNGKIEEEDLKELKEKIQDLEKKGDKKND